MRIPHLRFLLRLNTAKKLHVPRAPRLDREPVRLWPIDHPRNDIQRHGDFRPARIPGFGDPEDGQHLDDGDVDARVGEETAGADSAAVPECQLAGVGFVERRLVSFGLEGIRVRVVFGVVEEPPEGGQQVCALGYDELIVGDIIFRFVGQAHRSHGIPSPCFFHDAVNVGEVLPVVERWEAIGADDAVDFCLRLLHHLGEHQQSADDTLYDGDGAVGPCGVEAEGGPFDGFFIARVEGDIVALFAARGLFQQIGHVAWAMGFECHLLLDEGVRELGCGFVGCFPCPSSLSIRSTREPVGEILDSGDHIDSPREWHECPR